MTSWPASQHLRPSPASQSSHQLPVTSLAQTQTPQQSPRQHSMHRSQQSAIASHSPHRSPSVSTAVARHSLHTHSPHQTLVTVSSLHSNEHPSQFTCAQQSPVTARHMSPSQPAHMTQLMTIHTATAADHRLISSGQLSVVVAIFGTGCHAAAVGSSSAAAAAAAAVCIGGCC